VFGGLKVYKDGAGRVVGRARRAGEGCVIFGGFVVSFVWCWLQGAVIVVQPVIGASAGERWSGPWGFVGQHARTVLRQPRPWTGNSLELTVDMANLRPPRSVISFLAAFWGASLRHVIASREVQNQLPSTPLGVRARSWESQDLGKETRHGGQER